MFPCLLAAVIAQAQPAPLVEKIEVNIVNVDVAVTSHGEPARGLTAADFEVLEDGVPQTITNFYAVERGREAAVATEPSASAPPDDRFRRKVLVIVDNVSTTVHNRNAALRHLEQFIDQHFNSGEYDWSIAIASQRLHLALEPTSDKAAIHAAIDQIRRTGTTDLMRAGTFEPRGHHGIASDDRASSLIREADALEAQFLQSLTARAAAETIAAATRAFATVSGRKIILLLTGDVGLSDVTGSTSSEGPTTFDADMAEMARGIVQTRNGMIAEANASNVSLYILNTEGMDGDSRSMYWLARETGGRVMLGNDASMSLREFDRVSANFYSIGYRPAHGDDGKYHRIKVRLKKSGRYSLQYRDGYSGDSIVAQLERAVSSSAAVALMPSKFDVAVTTGNPVVAGSGVFVPINASVAAKDLQFIPSEGTIRARVDVYLSLFDMDGQNVSVDQFTHDAKVAPGAAADEAVTGSHVVRLQRNTPYRLVVAVRDHLTDAVGITQKLVRF